MAYGEMSQHAREYLLAADPNIRSVELGFGAIRKPADRIERLRVGTELENSHWQAEPA